MRDGACDGADDDGRLDRISDMMIAQQKCSFHVARLPNAPV